MTPGILHGAASRAPAMTGLDNIIGHSSLKQNDEIVSIIGNTPFLPPFFSYSPTLLTTVIIFQTQNGRLTI